MSDTPQTDAHEESHVKSPNVRRYYASLKKMRQLERELNAAKAALSGRTVSCSNCNAMAEENAAMREAIKEAHAALTSLEECRIFYGDSMDIANHTTDDCATARAKLKPHLK